eukprot:1546952-Pleurochrysis_carterae.AAC.1
MKERAEMKLAEACALPSRGGAAANARLKEEAKKIKDKKSKDDKANKVRRSPRLAKKADASASPPSLDVSRCSSDLESDESLISGDDRSRVDDDRHNRDRVRDLDRRRVRRRDRRCDRPRDSRSDDGDRDRDRRDHRREGRDRRDRRRDRRDRDRDRRDRRDRDRREVVFVFVTNTNTPHYTHAQARGH